MVNHIFTKNILIFLLNNKDQKKFENCLASSEPWKMFEPT
jgi:hypothetical protein